jgi:hypothetical protein
MRKTKEGKGTKKGFRVLINLLKRNQMLGEVDWGLEVQGLDYS